MAEILQRYIDRGKTLQRAHIGEGPCSLNSITTALYTIHRRQQCTGCSFQLLFPQIPIEISFSRTMHFFPFEKKERKSISGFNTCGSRSIPAPAPLFLRHAFFLHFSFHLWQMVNRNNSVWLLGGQGAAGGENTAADESAWAGITQGVCDVNLSEERHGQKSRGSAASVANTLLTYGSKGGEKKSLWRCWSFEVDQGFISLLGLKWHEYGRGEERKEELRQWISFSVSAEVTALLKTTL